LAASVDASATEPVIGGIELGINLYSEVHNQG
jgi:hypothetical protein